MPLGAGSFGKRRSRGRGCAPCGAVHAPPFSSAPSPISSCSRMTIGMTRISRHPIILSMRHICSIGWCDTQNPGRIRFASCDPSSSLLSLVICLLSARWKLGSPFEKTTTSATPSSLST